MWVRTPFSKMTLIFRSCFYVTSQISRWRKVLIICCVASIVIYIGIFKPILTMDIEYFGAENLVSKVLKSTRFHGYFQNDHAASSDKKEWVQTSLYKIFEQHKNRTGDVCRNECDTKNDLGCAANNSLAWENAMRLPKFRYVPLLPENQYIYPFEVNYMKYPPLNDSNQLPDLRLSKVIIPGAVDGQVVCRVNEVIHGRVDLVNGYGQQRRMGGDDVRVWIVDKKTGGYKAVGTVSDLRNGSYQISARCLWPGELKLYVAVAYPREFIRIVIDQLYKGISWFFGAKFRKATAEEVTLCYSTPNVPGRPCICNFTSVNGQSLYCGRPLQPSLTCDDWVEVFSLSIPPPQQVTPVEQTLIQNTPSKMSKKLIAHNFTLRCNDTQKLPELKPCKETNRSVTWEADKPNGYWMPDKTWTTLTCKKPHMTREWPYSCLKNTTVWIIGDSNGVRITNALSGWVNADFVKRDEWPNQYIKMNKKNGIKITFTPPEYPLTLGRVWRKRLPYGCVAEQIDNIPSTGKQVLILHYFLHLAPSHPNVYFFRLKAAHDAIKRLINRNPSVLVGIRGPHVSSYELDFNHAVGGDVLSWYLSEIIHNIFADLRDKVVFLDGREMTIAIENESYHPSDHVPMQMVQTLLSFSC